MGVGTAEVSCQSQAGPFTESSGLPVATIPSDETCAGVKTLHGAACARDVSSGFTTCGAPDGNLPSPDALPDWGVGVPATVVGVEHAAVITATAAVAATRPAFKVW